MTWAPLPRLTWRAAAVDLTRAETVSEVEPTLGK